MQQDTFLVMHQQVEIDEVLKSIWEVDTDTKITLTREERLCERIYEKTHKRTEEGRYMVNLPFNTDAPRCTEGNTKDIAEKRLLQLERRFKKMSKLKENYTNVIKEYLSLQHMEEVPKEEKGKEKCVYLPHHAVLREDKESTKTRLVFDASCKGSNNISLNNELLVGPPLQEDLRNLIMRWRMKRICYMSDIQKMYRQIFVFPEDADTYQRILWRSDASEDIKEYRILRVTFGTASAPYLAVRTLHQIANDEGKNHPKAAQIIKEEFYMDDLMSGADTVEEAVTEAIEVDEMVKKGGFTPTKWASNNLDFMQAIKPEDRSSSAHFNLNIDGTVKALGIKWNMGTDKFKYEALLPPIEATVTNRSVLSDIQKLFDLLGWMVGAPSMVMTKVFIQKLWLEKLNWDDKISSHLLDEWISIRSDFQQVNEIEFDRWIGTTSKISDKLEIHGFCDASMKAYAALVYARIKAEDGTFKIKLIAARTRVAPLRTISLPRLELCGALLLSRLLKQVAQAMRMPPSQVFAWTDSSIVLAWLAGDPHKWKLFVANRVVEIVENVHCSRWHHVISKNNPADIASRGMLLSELKSCKLWWAGPTWLLEKQIQFSDNQTIETDLEIKRTKIQVNINITEAEEKTKQKKLIEQLENFETLQEMLKVITYCRRFLNYKKNTNNIPEPLNTEDLDRSLKARIRLVQHEEFADEIQRLKDNKPVKTNSYLKSLNPFLDEVDIFRVGGCLRHSELEEKHSIILGTKNNLTPLIIADVHFHTMHGGVQLTLCYLRSKYWILKVKGLVKSHIHKCLTCAKQAATVRTQVMGDLPKERVTPARAFLNSGVDFCGPFKILNNKGRGAKTRKAYIALFICMSTKAIHLELVGAINTWALFNWSSSDYSPFSRSERHSNFKLNTMAAPSKTSRRFLETLQTEYLTRLQQRPKWQRQQHEFELGDIVLVESEGLPPGKWCLGRIVDKHPGSDGHTRMYSVKSGCNIVKRSVTKLRALPIDTKS